MLGRTGLHAVKALAALAEAEEDAYVGAAALSRRTRSPRNYLGKLLQALARAGLVEGQKGLKGGFRLARKPALISLFDVVEPIEPVGRWKSCFLTHGPCGDERPCKVHARWAAVRDGYLRFLKETSLLDLVDGSAPTPLAVRPAPRGPMLTRLAPVRAGSRPARRR